MIPRLEIHFNRLERRMFRQGKVYTMPKGEYWMNHCRSGILLALRALNLKPRTGVGMMVYNCHTVMNAIWHAGCKPVFVDITEELKIDMEDLARKREQINVLIVTHLFGIVNDVKEIKRLYPDLIVIEDCAHYFEHEIVGEFGVYSVGQGKFPSIGDGGILKTSGKWQKVIDDLYKALPEYTRKQEMKLYIRLWGKAMLYLPWLFNLTSLLKEKRGNVDVHEEVMMMKMSRGIANILASTRDNYPPAIQERLINAKRIKGAMIGENAFMVILRTEEPELLRKQYAKMGIDTDTHFKHCIDWAREFGYRYGDCPRAERQIKKLLMIPTYARI